MDIKSKVEPARSRLNSSFRLGAAVQVSKINDCCYRKQSFHQAFEKASSTP